MPPPSDVTPLHGPEAEELATYGRLQRVLEISAITLFFAGTPVVLLEIAAAQQRLQLPNVWALTVMGGVCALLFSDFISGFVHWAADNWGTPEWPIIGPALIRPFRHHHVDPKAMTHHDFIEMNGNNCLISLPAMYGSFIVAEGAMSAVGYLHTVFWLAVCYWVLATNQVHAWAHTENPPHFVRWLQKARLILTPENHHVHHTVPHNRNYCITTGWLNVPLRWMRFFEGMEWLVEKTFGVRPNHLSVAKKQQASPSLGVGAAVHR